MTSATLSLWVGGSAVLKIKRHLRNKFDFSSVHEIMTTSDLMIR